MRVYYHANCNDGFAAATVVYKKFKTDQIKYIPIQYGTDVEPSHVKDYILFVDFCPSIENIKMLLSKGHEVEIIDHHKTAKDNIEEMGDKPGLRVTFNMNKCGALLTWERFFPGQSKPPLLKYINDRDMWEKKYEESDTLAGYLQASEKLFEQWDHWMDYPPIKEALQIESYKNALVKQLVEKAYDQKVGVYNVKMVNTPLFQSDVCAMLLDQNPSIPFSLCAFHTGDQRVVSIRSRGDFDVSEIAKKFGGGGHPAASGFKVKSLKELITME